MTKTLFLLPLLAALTAAPVFAQQTAQTEGEAPAAEAPADGAAAQAPAAETPNVGGNLDLGEDVNAAAERPAAAAQAETYVRETFTDWDLQCLRVPEGQGEDVCQMYQLLKDENGASVAEASIFQLNNGGRAVAGGTFIVPLETLLTQKMTVVVDSGSARRYDFSFCAPIGCYARVGFTAEDIARFKRGNVAKITIVPALAPDQKVTVEMSLAGFTAAFDATTPLNQ